MMKPNKILLINKMKADLHTKIQAILWDIPVTRRMELSERILADPVGVFSHDEHLFIEVLNSLSWYELTKLVTIKDLLSLLNDSTIRKLFPKQRQTYYINARRLLSKYFIPSAGQGT